MIIMVLAVPVVRLLKLPMQMQLAGSIARIAMNAASSVTRVPNGAAYR